MSPGEPINDPPYTPPAMPCLYDMDSFWNQHKDFDAITLMLIAGDHMDKLREIVNPPQEEFESVSVKQIHESPANLMDSLRRRVRGPHTHGDAFFRTSAHTAMIEGLRSWSCREPPEAHRIARLCGARVTVLEWGRETSIAFIVAEPEGIVSFGSSSDSMRMAFARNKGQGFGSWIAPHPLVTGDPTTRQVEAMMRDELKLDFKTDLLAVRPVTWFVRKVKVNTLILPPGCDHIDQRSHGWKLTAKDAEEVVREAIATDVKGMTRRGDPKPRIEAYVPVIADGVKRWRVHAEGSPPVGSRKYDVDAMSGVAKRVE